MTISRTDDADVQGLTDVDVLRPAVESALADEGRAVTILLVLVSRSESFFT